jgi:putative membrane protein
VAARRELVYRHLAWINALRLQLRRTSRFFDKPAPSTRRRLQAHAEHMRNDWSLELAPFLDPDKLEHVSAHKNAATALGLRQAERLAELHRGGHLDLFHQIALMELLASLTTLQGQAERIKNTPFPRQYAEFIRIFVKVFAFLVPFGLLDVFADHVHAAGSGGAISWTPIIPMLASAALITWVFMTMEGIGDASEDPFERSMNDVPMNALCRTIEIDLREMLGEAELPAPETSVDGLLY